MRRTHAQLLHIGLASCLLVAILVTNGCIGDDLVFDEIDPVVRISNPVDTIALGANYRFEYSYLDEVGAAGTPSTLTWRSLDPEIIEIMDDGDAVARQVGTTTIIVEAQSSSGTMIADENMIVVGNTTVIADGLRSGEIQTTSSYKLQGAFTLEAKGSDLELNFGEDYEASTSLPGLYLYMTNNPNTINNALEIGAVEVFEGAHIYTIKNTGINDYSHLLYYCKPFVVKVGDGKISE